ncbi:alpha/beta fold hydrolase [Roseateles sp. P5_E4]
MSKPTSRPTSHFAAVNGLKLYYQTQGAGAPLLLLHGGVAPDCFGANVEVMAKSRQVILVHLQGHGHTQDIDRPLRFESMADDVAQLIQHLGLGAVDMLGYSMGGGVALQTAIRHPGAVRHLIVMSQPMRHDAWFPEVRAAYEGMVAHAPQIAHNIQRSPMATMYPEARWEPLLRKIGELESREFDWRAEVAALKMPAMLIFADADAIQVDHMAEFYKALGGSQRDAGMDGSLRAKARLAIVPGATHYGIASSPEVPDLVSAFLGSGPESRG